MWGFRSGFLVFLLLWVSSAVLPHEATAGEWRGNIRVGSSSTAAPAESAVVAATTEYVLRQRGTIPIILTSPHGGNVQPDFLDVRDACSDDSNPSGCRGGRCSRSSDKNTFKLTTLLVDKIEEECGGKPYYVIGQIKRNYIDYNRDAFDPVGGQLCSFKDPDALLYWEAFHNQIETYLGEIQENCEGCGLLIDVHGFTDQDHPQAISLGMGNAGGQTVPNIRERDAELPFVYGEEGLVPNLLNYGEDHILEVAPEDINASYDGMPNGGYIVRRYSRRYADWGGPQSDPNLPMIDSIQMEFEKGLRQASSGSDETDAEILERTALAVARSLCGARDQYIDWWSPRLPARIATPRRSATPSF